MKYVRLVKYGKIRGYSDMYFPVYVLGFCPYIGKRGSEKTFIFAYRMQWHTFCSAQLVNLGTTFSNVLAKFCAWSAKLAALTSCSAFFLVATSNSVHIWLCNDTFIGQQYQIYWISTKFHRIQIGFWCQYLIWTN